MNLNPILITTNNRYMNFLNANANLSRWNRDEVCQLAYSFRQQKMIIGIVFVQALLSFFTLILLYLVVKNREARRVWQLISRDLKIVLFAGFIYYLIGSLNAFLMFGYKFVILILNFQPCFYVWSGITCYWSQKLYASICVVGYAMIHMSLLLERCYATFISKKESRKGVFGSTLAVMSFILAQVPQLMSLDPQNYENERFYCVSATTVINQNFVTSIYLGILFDCGITIGDFWLFLYNRNSIKRYKKQRHNFDLEHSFKLREMQLSITYIYPFSAVHSFTYCIQLIVYIYYTKRVEDLTVEGGVLMFECVNFSRIGANFLLISFLWLHNRLHKQPNILWTQQSKTTLTETDLYFRDFKRMIGSL